MVTQLKQGKTLGSITSGHSCDLDLPESLCQYKAFMERSEGVVN